MDRILAKGYIGVDGGGTGCRAAICDADMRVIGEGTSGPANATTDLTQTITSVTEALSRAQAEARLTSEDLTQFNAHVGLAGILDASDAARVAGALPLAQATVTDDRPTSTLGALDARDGVVAGIGTGSFVAARHGPSLHVIGGWGFALGDQASGAWLGRAALEVTLLARDGLETPSDLTGWIEDRFGTSGRALVAFGREAQPSDFAALAPGILAAAKARDPHGVRLLQRGAAYIERAVARLERSEADPLCLIGGIGPHYAAVLSAPLRARLIDPAGTALDGALRLARAPQDATAREGPLSQQPKTATRGGNR